MSVGVVTRESLAKAIKHSTKVGCKSCMSDVFYTLLLVSKRQVSYLPLAILVHQTFRIYQCKADRSMVRFFSSQLADKKN